jgi:flagellar motor protein MotB
MGFDKNFIGYWGLAGGVSVPYAEAGRNISVLYQYNCKTEGYWASSHTIYLVMNLGKHREKLIAQPPPPIPKDTGYASILDSLRKVKGITVEEEKEFVKITAAEVAIHFESGSSNLPAAAINALAEITQFLKKFPNFPVSIEGHTDSDPIVGRLLSRYPDNKALYKARAEKVKEYFIVTEKLPEQLFTTVGWGETKPIASNDTEEGKTINRRVVIIVKTH